MNKKGATLIELIISLGLVSVVLLFMMRLLVDVNNQNTNDYFAKDNQLNRIEIIRTIENDLSNNTLTNITTTSDSNTTIINFIYKNSSTSRITLNNDTLTYYIGSTNQTRRWVMDNATIYYKKISFSKTDSSNTFAFVLNIPIHTINDFNNEENNNIIDDINISYFGDKFDLVNNLNLCIGVEC